MVSPIDILVTGGTGFIGAHLIPVLIARGHRVRVLARRESSGRVIGGATAIIGDVLDGNSVRAALMPGDTLIHLVGTPHPNPSKADQFEKVDLISIRAAVAAAKSAAVSHLVYVSVAQPAPVMRAYLWVRTLGEMMIREAGLTATILRPWYVLGPGRHWPVLVKPLYKLAEMIPVTRRTAERLGLVTIEQMVNALVRAVEYPPMLGQQRIVDVPAIKNARP
ncbi:MAG TPA: NAD(P)-dependent oxidoreductase [Candidatus Binatia bacterium]|nr:NAD(P)-dependent oxidoreductase [Candidatus Binatia bacterium]